MSELPETVQITPDTGRPWYRVVFPAGSVWAETSDVHDAYRRLHEAGPTAKLQRCFMVRGTTPWEDFDPSENPT